MKHKIIVFFVILFLLWYFPVAFPYGQPSIGYSTVPDADADYLVSLRVSRFEPLYSSFSILYPPGRFFIQGVLFYLFSPSFVLITLWHALVVQVFFPASLFLMSFYFFEAMFNQVESKHKNLFSMTSAGLAILSTFLYMLFLRSAQEVHIFTALFLTVLLLPGKMTNIKKLLCGLFLGFVFLFRIDGGVILTIALVVNSSWRVTKQPRQILEQHRFLVAGFLAVWIPVLLLILFHGSIYRFFYDTIVLGLLIQPKFMSLPIPQNELSKVWLSTLMFLVSSSLAVFIDAANRQVQKFPLRVFAVLAVFSYVSALGRADEPHLWYGLIWLPVLLVYAIVRIGISLYQREKISIVTALISMLVFFFYGWLILKLKSPTFFLLSVSAIFLIMKSSKSSVLSLLIAGIITSLFIFHSVSYVKLIYAFPAMPSRALFDYRWVISEGDEVGGAVMQPKSDEQVLQQIRADIPKDERYLFIFPKNVLLNEYFHMTSPTRYIILTNERSNWTEQEIIDDLSTTHTKYFLYFPTSAELRRAQVWEWILKNTSVVHEYQFPTEKAELRIRQE